MLFVFLRVFISCSFVVFCISGVATSIRIHEQTRNDGTKEHELEPAKTFGGMTTPYLVWPYLIGSEMLKGFTRSIV